MHPLLRHTDHRPIPLRRGPWIMVQNWSDLLFAHWEMPAEALRKLIPSQLELDLFNGQAYVAVAPFSIHGLRPRYLPALPVVSQFLELNVRTYVRYKGIPGVWFFSLDAANLSAVWGARIGYALPYKHATMSMKNSGEKFDYSSRRLHEPKPAEFLGRYWPKSAAHRRDKNSLEFFLTERYCLYAIRGADVFRTYIHHLPWPLQDAEAEIQANTMAKATGIDLPNNKPLLHFSKFIQVLVWWPEKA